MDISEKHNKINRSQRLMLFPEKLYSSLLVVKNSVFPHYREPHRLLLNLNYDWHNVYTQRLVEYP